MEIKNFEGEIKYVERNGFCFNPEEKMRLHFAIEELQSDLAPTQTYLIGKINALLKDYYLVKLECPAGGSGIYWCTSTNWAFAKLPEAPSDQEVLSTLKQMNTFFTGEYDQVLMAGRGKPIVVDAEKGIFLPPKPITELDRLATVVQMLSENFATPKGSLKYVPAGTLLQNEGFTGLKDQEGFHLKNWVFHRKPKNAENVSKIERREATYDDDCADCVADDLPKNAWAIQKDVTGTIATLKSHLWPGLLAYHHVNTPIHGFFYFGDGIRNDNLPFMI